MDKYHKTKGGSGNKKMKKFPRILDYLEAYHKDVYDIIDDLAMHGALTPKRGGSITFLIPDKKYIAKIRKAIESDKPEEATDMVGSLILLDLFETPSDFSEKQDDVPNLLGKKVIIKGVSGNKVNIENGELTIDAGFKPFERQGSSKRGNLAVWDLKGEVEYENAPKATFKYSKIPSKGSRKTEGGCESPEIRKIVSTVTSEEEDCIRNGVTGPDGKPKSPIINAVARVLRVFSSDPKFSEENMKARSILTKHPVIDFYLLFHTPDIFPSSKVADAYKLGVDVNNNVDTIRNYFNTPINEGAAVLNPSSLLELNQERDNIRNSIQNGVNYTFNRQIEKIYNEVDENNRFPGYSLKIYPDCLANIFKTHKNLHLALDEAKYFIFRAVQTIKAKTPDWIQGRSVRANEYRDFFQIMEDCFSRLGDPSKSMILRQSMDSHEVYQSSDFWRTFGLQLPVASGLYDSELEDRVVRGGNESINIYSKDLIDVDREIDDGLNEYDNSDFALSDSAVTELKAYLKAHDGKFPNV